MAKYYRSPLVTQANAMMKRGELSRSTFSFDVQLQGLEPRGRARSASSVISSLGMDIRKGALDSNLTRRRNQRSRSCLSASGSLVVANVDRSQSLSTPVAAWNVKQNLREHRGVGGRRLSRTIMPGDKLCSVNGARVDDEALLDELVSAASMQNTKVMDITLERDVSDVLEPPGTNRNGLRTLSSTAAGTTSAFSRQSDREVYALGRNGFQQCLDCSRFSGIFSASCSPTECRRSASVPALVERRQAEPRRRRVRFAPCVSPHGSSRTSSP